MDCIVKVPSNLDLDKIMSSMPPIAFKSDQKSKERLYYFCGTITLLKLKHGGYNEEHKGYTSLHSKYLKLFIADYKPYLEYLVKAGVLEEDGIFQKGTKSKGYRYTVPYMGVPLKNIELEEYSVRKGFKRVEKDKQTAIKPKSNAQYKHIYKWSIDDGLEIKKREALNAVNNHYRSEMSEVFFDERINDEEKKIRIKKLSEVQQASQVFVGKLDSKAFIAKDFKQDEFGRRLHGMFTYMPAYLRPFISYKGQTLVSSDVKNSQPYFTTVTFNRDFWRPKNAQTSLLKWSEINEEMYRYVRKQPQICEGIKWLASSGSLAGRRLSIERYKEDVVSGRLYEKFKLKLDASLSEQYIMENGLRVADRQGVKKEVLKTFYSKNSWMTGDTYEPSRVFESLYPDVMRFFKALKSGEDFVLGEQEIKGYKFFSLLLQQIESYCMLKLICGSIAREKPDLPIFTIHDSIVTTQGNEGYIQGVIREVLRSKIGAEPMIKTEIWTTDNFN
jgi:hypothetical protein